METIFSAHCRTSTKDKIIGIEISDTGKGIPPEKLNTLFDFKFTTKTTRFGIGMGLMSAYNIIQKHKGEMEIKSNIGKGTTVSIALPDNPKNQHTSFKQK